MRVSANINNLKVEKASLDEQLLNSPEWASLFDEVRVRMSRTAFLQRNSSV